MSDKKDTTKTEKKNINKEKNLDNLEYSKKIGDYILFDQIGMGTFSKVTRAFHLITEQTVAVKILDKEKIEDEIDIERIIREIEILKNIHHPNIAQMYETYSTIHNFYLMIEYVSGGDLFDYITSHNYLSEKKACYFFRQIISVLEYLIDLGISHRDIKPENILLNESHTQIKFIDFGLSNYCNQNELLHSSCGSPCYASPEMLSGKAYRGVTTDLWSAGIVLYSMLVGALPFDDQELHKLYEQIKVGKFYIPSTLSLEAIDLLKQILEVDPKKRINIEGVKNHKWFKLEENPLYKGINISVEHFPCDTKAASYVIKNYFKDDKNISFSMLVKMIHTHECNRYTATYYLVKNNILGIKDNFKVRKESKNKNNENKDNIGKKENKDNNKIDNNNINSNEDIKKNDEKKNNNKELINKEKDNEIDLFLNGLINKKKEEINTRNKNNEIIEIKNNLGNSQKNEEIFYFTGNIEDDNQKLRSKTEEDVNTFFSNNNKKSSNIKKVKKKSNDDNLLFIKDVLIKKNNNENDDVKNSSNKGNSKKIKVDNVKKKSSNKDYKNSNKKSNKNENRTGKIVIPILNIKKTDNGINVIKLDEKCITDRPINNLKKNQKNKNNNQNKILNIQYNNKNNSKVVSKINKLENKNINNKKKLEIKNPSKNKVKKNKTNSPKSTNNLNFYVINNIINKDNIKNVDSNGNEIISFISKTHERINSTINDKKKVFDKIKINFKSDKDYKYIKSPSDINLISKNSNNQNNNSNSNNNNNQLCKTNNNNDFNEGILFSNRIKFNKNKKNTNINTNTNVYNSSNLFMRTSNNMQNKIIINNNDLLDNNIKNNNLLLYENNNKDSISVNQYINNNNSQNKKINKKKNLNIFTNYIKQKNIYNLFNNDYSKNQHQTHQRNFKSALKYQLTEFKTDNQVVTNNFFLPKKKTVSRNKKSSYNKEYNTNFLSKNKNNNIIKEYANKLPNNNNNHKQANSIDDTKNNFSSTPKYINKMNNSKDKKKYFVNHNILNIDYLLRGKNKKNKLILTSTIANNNNSPKNIYNIGQNYLGNAFLTEGNMKNNSTNKNRENLSVVLNKGMIKKQKKINKDIFSLKLNDKNKNNNSNNIYSNINNNNNNNKINGI